MVPQRATLFVALLSGLKGILDLPFSWISTFKIEAKYGFNRTTLGTFIMDRVKGSVLGLGLLAPILASHTLPGGLIALSGILEEQAADVVLAYAPWARLEIAARETGWVLLVGARAA